MQYPALFLVLTLAVSFLTNSRSTHAVISGPPAGPPIVGQGAGGAPPPPPPPAPAAHAMPRFGLPANFDNTNTDTYRTLDLGNVKAALDTIIAGNGAQNDVNVLRAERVLQAYGTTVEFIGQAGQTHAQVIAELQILSNNVRDIIAERTARGVGQLAQDLNNPQTAQRADAERANFQQAMVDHNTMRDQHAIVTP